MKYHPDKSQPEEMLPKRLKLASLRPLKCYGDSTILSKMKLQEIAPNESLRELVGPIGNQIPGTFERIEDQMKDFKERYGGQKVLEKGGSHQGMRLAK